MKVLLNQETVKQEKIKQKEAEYREEYLAFLKEQLKEKCNSDMFCEIYWDYEEELDAWLLKKAIKEYKEEGYRSVRDYLCDKISEMNAHYDGYMFQEIIEEIQKCDNEHVTEYYNTECPDELEDLYEDALELGYMGIDINLDKLLNYSTFCVNVMFATDTERNYDMGSIVNAFGSWREPDFDYLTNNVDDLDNALTYLVHQQGHSIKEVYECLLNNPAGFGVEKLDFVKSVVNDIANNSSDAFSELTALINLDGKQILKFIEKIEKEEGYLTFDVNTEIGIFNEWSGCGGPLVIELDKPFIVPASMIRNVQIEGAGEEFGYTVGQVYGILDPSWKDTLGYTDEKPELFEENLEETVKYIKALSNPFELKSFGRDGEIIATVRNNTDFTLRFTFEESSNCNFGLSPRNSMDLYYDEQGITTLDALEAEEFKLEIIKQ